MKRMICTAVRVVKIVGRAREVVGRVSPADASGSGDLGPRVENVFMGAMEDTRGVAGAGLGVMAIAVVVSSALTLSVSKSKGSRRQRGEADRMASPDLPFSEGERAA